MDQIHFINLEYFFNKIFEFFTELGLSGSATGDLWMNIKIFFAILIRFILPVLIVVLLGLYFYYWFKVRDLIDLERNRTYERIDRTQQHFYKDVKNTRWERVVELFSSTVPSDWRMGVIEADAMLDSLLTSLGYSGATVAEKLKAVDRGNFPTLQDAWDAHLVRNKIAHDGMDFELDTVLKNRVFKQYEKVFLDAQYI